MKCPKCSKEYNTMEEVVECLNGHIKEQKEAEKIRKQKKYNADFEEIKAELKALNEKVEKFNTIYGTTFYIPSVITTKANGDYLTSNDYNSLFSDIYDKLAHRYHTFLD